MMMVLGRTEVATVEQLPATTSVVNANSACATRKGQAAREDAAGLARILSCFMLWVCPNYECISIL